MVRKAGICEECGKSTCVYEVKKKEFTTGEIKESIIYVCSPCYRILTSFREPN